MYKGLTQKEAEQKISEGRINRQNNTRTDSYSGIIRKNTLTYFNLINTVLFIVILLTGKPVNGLFFLTAVFNSLIGIFQEIRAKKLLDGLRIMIVSVYEVCRDGEWVCLASEELTEGDLIRLASGMQVPADAIILNGRLEMNESMITGESETVVKDPETHVYAGTVVTSGKAELRILRVGEECIASHILDDAGKAVRSGSKLHSDMERLIKIVSVMILPVGLILFLTQYYVVGMEWNEAALKTTAAVVGMIPEGLVVLTSIALAVGTIRLSRQKVLVQDLYAIEMLARTDVICLDKTGTLTEGRMQAAGTVMTGSVDQEAFAAVMRRYLGSMDTDNMTSSALKAYFGADENVQYKDILPFSSDRKYAAVTFENEGTWYLGSPENLFPERPESLSELDQYVSAGNRVVVLAYSRAETIGETLPEDLVPWGMILITDVLRPNAAEIMSYFADQQITVYIISGDHPGTVSALAERAGVPDAAYSLDLSVIPPEPSFFADAVKKYRVFGRVMPFDKKNIIETLHDQGHCTAMTGDGVNDVAALNAADTAVSFASATQAARDSADIVLLSNDFAQLPSVINEGRRVINNIGRASSMYLVKTVFSVLLVLYAVLLQQEYPFLPVQLTLISAFGVGIPTFFMQMEPSFEKSDGTFLARAFRNAVPASVTVLFVVLYCMFTRNYAGLSAERYYGQVVVLTFSVYVFTLLRVSKPLSRWRALIILSVTITVTLIIMIIPQVFSIRLTIEDILMIVPAFVLIYPCVKLNEVLYDKNISRLRGVFNGKQNVSEMEEGSASDQKNHQS